MAYGSVNIPGVSASELETVRTLAPGRKGACGIRIRGHHRPHEHNQCCAVPQRDAHLYGQPAVPYVAELR